ncbi:MAG: fibronectin type III domain-containing protein [Deltaproteobacteria bacterium]|nr:fibronectin type III domain-containing protein [Deltaproteobacteria bacterium]
MTIGFVITASALDFTTAPTVGTVSTNSVSIEWVTDENSKGALLYGTQSGSLQEMSYSPNHYRFHRISLSGLLPNTTYYFKVRIKNEKGKTFYSRVSSFKTHLQIESLKPRFKQHPQVNSIEASAVWLEWKTNVPCQSTVYYGKTKGLLQKQELLIPKEDVRLLLSDLEPAQLYFFQIHVKNAYDEALDSKLLTFRTKPKDSKFPLSDKMSLQEPVLKYAPVLSSLSESRIVIEIVLNRPHSAHILYGVNELNLHADSPDMKELHRILLKDLKPNTVYTYRIRVSGKNLPETYQFKTLWL